MTQRIVFSSDHNPTYAWFCPLASIAWQHVAGFKPLVLMVGPVHPWIVHKTIETGAEVVALKNVPGVSSASMGQFCRLFAYLLPNVSDDDYLLTVDSDAWPCQSAVFQPSGKDFDAMYPNWCMPFFPIGYLGGKAKVWREIVKVDAPTIEAAVTHVNETDPVIAERRRNRTTTDPFFNYDEAKITELIRAWPGYPSRCHLVPREGGDLLPDRLDRIRWPADPSPEGKVDAHLLRPGWTPENWPRLLPLFAKLVPHMADWAQTYRDEWMEVTKS